MWKHVRIRAALVLLILLPAPPLCAGEPTGGGRVAIKVYDGSATGQETREAAIDTGADILALAGISASWFDCTGDAERGHCTPIRGARTLVVRIVPTLVSGSVPSHASVRSTAAGASGAIMGVAVVASSTGTGALATIFMDSVQAVASRAALPPAVLLGRVIAHEIGHLLLGSNSHSPAGLMRETWSADALASDDHHEWQFSPTDRRMLQIRADILDRMPRADEPR